MQNNPHTRSPFVRRITIDEKLASGLMRILVAELKNGIEAFDDDSAYWNEEKELLVQADNYRSRMDMTLSNTRKWPWESLYEGQTFLQGNFKKKRGRRDQPGFLVDMRKKNFQCIDALIKEHIKEVYFSALEGSINNGQAD
jgi:hypothetical protein